MQENVKRFNELLEKDEQLKNKIRAAFAAYDRDKNDDKAVFDAVIVPVAAQAGYEFTYEEAMAELKTSGYDGLSENELGEAAGGGFLLTQLFRTL